MMEVRTAATTASEEPDDLIRVMETLVIDNAEYNYGTISRICRHIEGLASGKTSRVTNDPATRGLLMERQVLAATDAYPLSHPWCRFHQGEGFEAFWSEVEKAAEELRKRESLNNPAPNPITSWLHGEVWSISTPAPDVLGNPEGLNQLVHITSDEAMGKVWLLLGDSAEESYAIAMEIEQAKEAGESLAVLVNAALQGQGNMTRTVQTEMETIRFDWDLDAGTIGLSGDGWGVEDGSGVEFTANQADELSWQLREQAACPSSHAEMPETFDEDEFSDE